MPAEEKHVQEALKELCGPEHASWFQAAHLNLLLQNGYSTLVRLKGARHETLMTIGLPFKLIDTIIHGQKEYRKKKTLASNLQETEITFKMGKRGKQARLFTGTPSWQNVCAAVEKTFPDMKVEDFELRAGRVSFNGGSWSVYAADKTTITLEVISMTKSFSAFEADEAYHLLDTRMPFAEVDDDTFPLADYDGSKQLPENLRQYLGLNTADDVIHSLSKELAMRCYQYPAAIDVLSRGASRRELIGPLLYAAAGLSGDVAVMAEFSVKGTVAKGRIDYALFFNQFSVVVFESKHFEVLQDHMGQVAAGMRTMREHYCRTRLGKRKHEDEGDFHKVPSFGIVSNGDDYIFYKYTPETRSLVRSSRIRMHLDRGIRPSDVAERALPVVRRLVRILDDQKESMAEAGAKRTKIEGTV